MSLYRKQVLLRNLIVLLTASVISIVYVGVRLHSSPGTMPWIWSILGGYTFLGNDDVVLQEEQSDCGPAALANVFAHYGMEMSLEEIKSILETTEEGTSMLQLKEMAELKGLKAEGWKYTWEDFQNSTLPAIVFVRGNHYVVAESIHDDGSLVVVDPSIGRLKVSQRRFRRIWSGETLRMQKADSRVCLPETRLSVGHWDMSTDNASRSWWEISPSETGFPPKMKEMNYEKAHLNSSSCQRDTDGGRTGSRSK